MRTVNQIEIETDPLAYVMAMVREAEDTTVMALIGVDALRDAAARGAGDELWAERLRRALGRVLVDMESVRYLLRTAARARKQ